MGRKRRRSVTALFRAANAEQLRRNGGGSSIARRRGSLAAARALYVVTDRKIVKLGITTDVERRLAEHRRQGLWKVVYVLRADRPGEVRRLELEWRRFVLSRPHLAVSRTTLRDGYTEALALEDEVRAFIDQLVGKR